MARMDWAASAESRQFPRLVRVGVETARYRLISSPAPDVSRNDLVGPKAQGKARRDLETGAGQLAQVRALAAHGLTVPLVRSSNQDIQPLTASPTRSPMHPVSQVVSGASAR